MYNGESSFFEKRFWLFVAFPLILGCAHTEIITQPDVRAEVVSRQGDTLVLSHDHARDAKGLFCAGETVKVYRFGGRSEQGFVVGKVMIDKYISEREVQAHLVEGDVRPGDMAVKGSVACTRLFPPGEKADKQRPL
ncbi:MAG: hypothetical protein ABSG42_09125 [Nitrospirota bacterium]